MSQINIEEPRWDQSTFIGRMKHFSSLLDPQHLLCTPEQLDAAKLIVDKYRKGEEVTVTMEDIWKAKYLYDSAFRSDTGDKIMLIGRLSGQVPINTIIAGGLLTFCKSTPAVIFWQWLNQSYNAVMNYAHRPADSPLSDKQLGQSYLFATGCALSSALTLKYAVAQGIPPIVGRLVPFAGVLMGNCINITRIRIRDLQDGMPLFDEYGIEVGRSNKAAEEAVIHVWMSKAFLVSVGLVLPPVVIHSLEKGGFFKRLPWLATPLQLLICSLYITLATPVSYALFAPKTSHMVSSLEPEVQTMISKLPGAPDTVFCYRRIEAQAT